MLALGGILLALWANPQVISKRVKLRVILRIKKRRFKEKKTNVFYIEKDNFNHSGY